MLIHDQLLTGDPLYWTGVAGHYAAGTTRSLPAASQVVREIVERYWLMSAAVVLAAVGVVQLLDQRRYWLLAALAGLGPGIAGFLVFLAIRGLDVPIRYAIGVDVALFLAAGIGLGAISLRLRSWPPLQRARDRLGEGAAGVAMVVLVGFLAILATGPYWRQNPNIRANVGTSRELAAATDRALPSIAAALRSGGVPVPGKPIVLAPGAIRPRLVVDLRTSLEDVGGVAAGRIDVAAGYPSAGQVVFHVRDVDPKVAAWSELETEQPRTIGSVRLEPVFTDPSTGIWVIAVR